ncbi:trypsin-like [Epargyreus clarus]|uniref:trypsin-like n=1 Tax=Epargyreus clarus TaxID=520877 RepID=UPI003C303AAC
MVAGSIIFLAYLISSAVKGDNSLHGNISRRIVRGFHVNINSFPHAVFLYFSSVKPSTCGSSLITTKAVVTSAHCMREMKLNQGGIYAYLGSSVPIYAKVVRNITCFKIHPNYNPAKGKYDLAVAKFNREVPIGKGIHKIPISLNSLVDNDALFSAGWGKQWPLVLPDYSDMRHLEVTKQRVLSMNECLEYTGIRISPAYICTLPLTGYHYQGDMGNGLVTTKPSRALVGVVSFMVRGATLYASLLNERPWLRETVKVLYKKEPVDKDCC